MVLDAFGKVCGENEISVPGFYHNRKITFLFMQNAVKDKHFFVKFRAADRIWLPKRAGEIFSVVADFRVEFVDMGFAFVR